MALKKYNKFSKYNWSYRTYYGAKTNSKAAIKAIVVHWVGAVSTAKNNIDYFAGGNRGASAHMFIDDTTIGKSVREKYAAWAVGKKYNTIYDKWKGAAKYWGVYNNGNTYSIEMCCSRVNGKTTVTDKTISNTVKVLINLCKRYKLTEKNIFMHFNIAGKDCPGVFMSTKTDPDATFKTKILDKVKAGLKNTTTTTTTTAKTTTTTVKTTTTTTTAKKTYNTKPKVAIKQPYLIPGYSSNRKTWAKLNGISNYTGTATQNLKILDLYNNGKLIIK